MAFERLRLLAAARFAPKVDKGLYGIVRRLLDENWRSQWRRWAVSFVYMAIGAAATAAWAWLQKDLVNAIFFEKRMEMLLPLTAAVIVLPLIRGFAGYGQEVVLNKVGNRIVAAIQRKGYKHILPFGVGFFTSR